MPKEITLPATITLSNNDTVNLKNTGALVSIKDVKDKNGNQVGPSITPPANLTTEQMPSKIAPLPEAQREITIPTFEVNTSNAGKTVKQSDGKYYQYDDAGRVECIYDTEADKDADRCSTTIFYGNNGKIEIYQQNTYDEQGHCTGSIEYDSNGKFSKRCVNDQFDENNPERYGRQTMYNADGSINEILCNFEYDEQGREVSYDNFKTDGSWICSRKLNYGNDGTCQTRFYGCDNHGRLTKIED
jgi:hypothetical protein